MVKRQPDKRKRSPIILLVCEGRNKTEKKFFSHFQQRDSKYKLIIKDSEATDINGMARRAYNLYRENQMDPSLGDMAFCLIDLDCRKDKYETYLKVKDRPQFKNIEFVLSNPCFEVWLLYYFTEHPKVELCSQSVKEQLRKYVPEYTESLDIYEHCKLQDLFAVAINRSEKKNICYDESLSLVDRNPYTQVQDLIVVLKTNN